jgi:hypothetical protein
MVNRADRTQPGVTQRDDRGGTRIVRIGLVAAARVQQSHPRRQRRWDVNNAFTSRDELLRKQRAETASSFDCPGARLERCREPQQSVALPTIRVDAQLTDEFLRIVEHRCGVRSLVRIDPDHEHHFLLHTDRRGMPRRAVLMRGDCSPLSSHAAARTRAAVTSLKSQPTTVAGHSGDRGPGPRTLRARPQRLHAILYQGNLAHPLN